MTALKIIASMLGLLAIMAGSFWTGAVVMVMGENDSKIPLAFSAVLVVIGLAAVGWAAS